MQGYEHLSHVEQKRVSSLMRRRDHLAERVAQNPDRDLSWDRRELAALNWALKFIEERKW